MSKNVAPRRGANPIELIKAAAGNATARRVLGAMSAEDLNAIHKANVNGELGRIANKILRAPDPLSAARSQEHPVAKALAKLQPAHLKALGASCPNCPP